jgi:C4-dicarboxylate-binding protein DctP
MVVASVDWLDGLDAGVRDQFLQILEEVTVERNADSTKVNEEAKQAILAAGGVVRELTPEQRAEWVAAMKPVWEKFEADVGADNIAAAQAINEKH